jgi:hypothetical protein
MSSLSIIDPIFYKKICYDLAFHRFQWFIGQVIFYKCISPFTNSITHNRVLEHVFDHIGLTGNGAVSRQQITSTLGACIKQA